MRKIHLIEWGIIIVGLIFGYKFFESIFSILAQFSYELQGAGGDFLAELTPILILSVIYGLMFIVVIRQSHSIAAFLSKNESGETIPLIMGKHALLQVVLIAVCAFTILGNIADLLIFFFNWFENEASSKKYYGGESRLNTYSFKIKAVQTIVAIVVIFFSKDISRWFIRKNDVEELVLESTEKKPEN